MLRNFVAAAILSAFAAGSALAQGFVVGGTATFQYPSNVQGGRQVTGTILELSKNLTLIAKPKPNGYAPTPYLRPQWSDVTSFRKTGERWKYLDPAGTFTRDVYEIQGPRVSGKFVFENIGSVRLRDAAGVIHVGWGNYPFLSAGGGLTSSTSGVVVSPPAATSFADPGGSMALGRLVTYPSRIEGYMAQGDYDMFTFDFPGGAFTARSTGGLNLVADLWDARSGKSIARAIATSGSFSFTMPNLPPGRYGLQVRVMHHAGSGDYGLELGGGGKVYREVR